VDKKQQFSFSSMYVAKNFLSSLELLLKNWVLRYIAPLIFLFVTNNHLLLSRESFLIDSEFSKQNSVKLD